MASLDPTVASILDTSTSTSTSTADLEEDTLLDTLENDDTTTSAALAAFRTQRLHQLHSELSRAKEMRGRGYGVYTEIEDEKTLMDIVTAREGTRLCVVVHFFKGGFGRCGIMDGHLEALAPQHFDTRFLRINVENAPFLVTKLNIRILPCVLAFVDGVSVDRIVGFEGLGSYYGGEEDTFTTRDLEARLLRAGVLVRAKTTTTGDGRPPPPPMVFSRKTEERLHDSDEDDWD